MEELQYVDNCSYKTVYVFEPLKRFINIQWWFLNMFYVILHKNTFKNPNCRYLSKFSYCIFVLSNQLLENIHLK